MDDVIEQMARNLAQATSRRGFLGSVVRWGVGLGMGTAFVAVGRPAWADGPGPVGCGLGPNVATADQCDKPAGQTTYGYKRNCHWEITEGDYAQSDKYGCRARTGGGNPRPYCHTVPGHPSIPDPTTCGNMTGTGPPSCPSGQGYEPKGYWACCCDGANGGVSGSTLTYCFDCDKAGGNNCICLKRITVPPGNFCTGS